MLQNLCVCYCSDNSQDCQAWQTTLLVGITDQKCFNTIIIGLHASERSLLAQCASVYAVACSLRYRRSNMNCFDPWHIHAGTLVSTCFFQLWLAGLLVSTVIMLLLHPQWWEFVGRNAWWPISVILIIMWHIASQVRTCYLPAQQVSYVSLQNFTVMPQHIAASS